MAKLSDPRGFRKTVAGVCMIAAPALVVVSQVIHPREFSDEAKWLAEVSANADRQYWAHLLGLFALALAIPGILGAMHMLKERRPALGHIGAGLALFGTVSLAAVVGTEFVVWQAAKAPATDAAAMTSLIGRIIDSPGMILLYVLALTFPLGLLVLGIGLYLARAAATWEAVLVALPFTVGIVSEIAYGPRIIPIVASVLFLIGLGSIGRRVLTESDEEWEHTPEIGGMRPATGSTEYRLPAK
jgi:hypothetical protein